jgi:hypothetical protein
MKKLTKNNSFGTLYKPVMKKINGIGHPPKIIACLEGFYSLPKVMILD